MSEEAFTIVRGSVTRQKPTAILKEQKEPTQQEIDELYKERITSETELPPMQPLLQMFGVPCFYRGELVADCGKAKSGKTFFLSILMAACLSKKSLALERASLPSSDDYQPDDISPLKVLWLDTEQSQQSTQEILRDRIIPLSGINPQTSDISEKLYAFNLRGLGFDKRKKMVEVALRTINPDICIIDGIKDLMTDINDAVQATTIMEKLMSLAKELNCCIVCVLHLNKAQQDRNMRGSIGTELTNKAFEVFQCEMIEESDTFKVSQTFSRKQKMKENLYYRVNDQGLPKEADFHEQPRDAKGRWVSTKTANQDEKSKAELQQLFTKAMEGRTQRPFGELMAVALKKCGVIDSTTYYKYLSMAINYGIIRKEVQTETGVTWVELCDNVLPF